MKIREKIFQKNVNKKKLNRKKTYYYEIDTYRQTPKLGEFVV